MLIAVDTILFPLLEPVVNWDSEADGVLERNKLKTPPPRQHQLGPEDLLGVSRCCVTSLIKKLVWIQPSGQISSEMKLSALF